MKFPYQHLTLLVVLSSILFAQCKPNTPEQIYIDKQHKQIMVIHDEVMPKMKDIYQLKKKLKAQGDNPTALAHIKDLDEADELMMDWMAEYDKPDADTDYKIYLRDQETAIQIVKMTMLNSIYEARQYLMK